MKAKTYCIVFGCLNTNKDPNLTFFSLPKDIDRRRKWLTLVDRQDLLQKEDLKRKTYLVCSAHFEDSSIKIIKHLKENALPTIPLLNQPQESSSCLEEQPTSGQITIFKGEIYVTVGPQSKGQEEQTQSSESLIDGTPRKRKLLNELRKCKLKRQRIDEEILKIKEELDAIDEYL